MAFNLDQFRGALQFDGARPNLFEVKMTFPTLGEGATIQSSRAGNQISFFCRAAQLPGSTVNAVPVNYFGRELKFAGNRTFPEWTVTLLNDEDFTLRNAFELWLNGLNSHAGNRRNRLFTQSTSYTQNGSVTQYSKTGVPLKSYDFVGMFPIDISPIDVDWASNDAIEEYQVTFAYQWWESAAVNRSGGTPPVYNPGVV
jgi:hypothetical protein